MENNQRGSILQLNHYFSVMTVTSLCFSASGCLKAFGQTIFWQCDTWTVCNSFKNNPTSNVCIIVRNIKNGIKIQYKKVSG